MISVTVEGSILPCTELPRGERRTVALTERVQRLIDRGYFTLIETHADPDASADHLGTTLDDPSGDTPLATGDFAPADDEPTEPAESALKGDWQAWLNHKSVWFPDDATKPQLIAAWREVQQQQAASNG